MEEILVKEVIACLQSERKIFEYYPDRYAVYLLDKCLRSSEEKVQVRDLRKNKWGRLLERPMIKRFISRKGDGELCLSDLNHLWPDNVEPFVLTFGIWGAKQGYHWSQTSRPGSNLVLQLNLNEEWGRRFSHFVNQTANDYFDVNHPISRTRGITLAWARLDVDFETDEVLIEEVQSDLTRYIKSMLVCARIALSEKRRQFYYWGDEIDVSKFLVFAEDMLKVFSKTWQEAMLTATLEFVFDELGVKNAYYHSFETGNLLKGIKECKPPKSLYSALPKQFCFDKIKEAPEFIRRDKKAKRKLKITKEQNWYYLAA